ncbi:hypothetical protein Pla100_12150 [Neorhodopirellula pilleata]|uniref:Uncharacterized protein n=1 Tax=Neorhodopirellula pilleata TaxID=2714738 RepID=A0A5C6AP71_9BACT|nr:hypothetical protein Pla100_12150 [Neorhodopirellula pilleata]
MVCTLLPKPMSCFVSALQRGSDSGLPCGFGDGSNLHVSLTRNDFSLMVVSSLQNRNPMTWMRLCGFPIISLNDWNAVIWKQWNSIPCLFLGVLKNCSPPKIDVTGMIG